MCFNLRIESLVIERSLPDTKAPSSRCFNLRIESLVIESINRQYCSIVGKISFNLRIESLVIERLYCHGKGMLLILFQSQN